MPYTVTQKTRFVRINRENGKTQKIRQKARGRYGRREKMTKIDDLQELFQKKNRGKIVKQTIYKAF